MSGGYPSSFPLSEEAESPEEDARCQRTPIGWIKLDGLDEQALQHVAIDSPQDARRTQKGFEGTTIGATSATFPAWKIALALRPHLVDHFLDKITKEDIEEAAAAMARLFRFSKEIAHDMTVLEEKAESSSAVMARLWDYSARVLIFTVFSRWFRTHVLMTKVTVPMGEAEWMFRCTVPSDPAWTRTNKAKGVLLHSMITAMARVAEEDVVSPFCITSSASAGLSRHSKSLLLRSECACDETAMGDYYVDPSMLVLPSSIARVFRKIHLEHYTSRMMALGLRVLFQRRRIRHAHRVIEGDSMGVMRRVDALPYMMVWSMVGQIGERCSIYSVLEGCVRRSHARAAPPSQFVATPKKLSLTTGKVYTASKVEAHTLYHYTFQPIIEFCRIVWGLDAFVRAPSTKRWGFVPGPEPDLSVAKHAAKAWLDRPPNPSCVHAAKRRKMDDAKESTRREEMDVWRNAIPWHSAMTQLE